MADLRAAVLREPLCVSLQSLGEPGVGFRTSLWVFATIKAKSSGVISPCNFSTRPRVMIDTTATCGSPRTLTAATIALCAGLAPVEEPFFRELPPCLQAAEFERRADARHWGGAPLRGATVEQDLSHIRDAATIGDQRKPHRVFRVEARGRKAAELDQGRRTESYAGVIEGVAAACRVSDLLLRTRYAFALKRIIGEKLAVPASDQVEAGSSSATRDPKRLG